MKYDMQFNDVEFVVKKLFPPKGKRGYNYSVLPKNPSKELTEYIDPTYRTIMISTFDQTPRWEEKEIVPSADLGLKINGEYNNFSVLVPEHMDEVFKGTAVNVDAIGEVEKCKISVPKEDFDPIGDLEECCGDKNFSKDGSLLEFIVSLTGLKPTDWDTTAWAEVMKAAINVRSLQR